VRRYVEALNDAYLATASEFFVSEQTNCGQFNSELDFFYCFEYEGRTLDLFMVFCCGDGEGFGNGYVLPNVTSPGGCEYVRNEVGGGVSHALAMKEMTDADMIVQAWTGRDTDAQTDRQIVLDLSPNLLLMLWGSMIGAAVCALCASCVYAKRVRAEQRVLSAIDV